MLIAKKPLKNENNGKNNKGHKQRISLQVIYLPVTWLIDYLSFIYYLSTVLSTMKMKQH